MLIIKVVCKSGLSLILVGLCFCSFLNLYGTEEGECISLDEAASSLGVERRRIYDIVNVLESVEVKTLEKLVTMS